MAPLRDHHATILIPPDGAAAIDRLRVGDFDGAYGMLRKALLQPPFEPNSITPHVTVIHPRTSARGREFWDSPERPRRVDGEFTVREVTITAFDGTRWVVTARFALRGR